MRVKLEHEPIQIFHTVHKYFYLFSFGVGLSVVRAPRLQPMKHISIMRLNTALIYYSEKKLKEDLQLTVRADVRRRIGICRRGNKSIDT